MPCKSLPKTELFFMKNVDMQGGLFIMRPRCHRAVTPLIAPEVAAHAER